MKDISYSNDMSMIETRWFIFGLEGKSRKKEEEDDDDDDEEKKA